MTTETDYASALHGLDAARRAGWAKAYAAEESLQRVRADYQTTERLYIKSWSCLSFLLLLLGAEPIDELGPLGVVDRDLVVEAMVEGYVGEQELAYLSSAVVRQGVVGVDRANELIGGLHSEAHQRIHH